MSRERGPRRGPVLVLVLGLVVAGLAADRLVRRPGPPATLAQVAAVQPVAAPDSALSSTWFCAASTATQGGAFDGSVVIANPTNRKLQGTLTVVPAVFPPPPQNQAEPVVTKAVALTVDPLDRVTVRLGDVVVAPYAAAVVEVNGGEAVVEHVVTGPQGDDVAPCASEASSTWHFAAGTTVKDATLLLAMFNPFPELAIVDLSFATDQGRAVPGDFQGIQVPGRSLVVRDVGEHVRRREQVSTTVEARQGRLVVDQVQVVTGGAPALTMALGAPSAGTVWDFPDGIVAGGVAELFHVYNPSDEEAEVDVEITVADAAVEPFQLTVAPQSRVVIDLGKEETMPKSVPHATVVRSLNGVPVVAERQFDARPPAGRVGGSRTLGSRVAAVRWVLAAGGATEALDEWVVVHSPGSRGAKVSFTALAGGQAQALEGLQEVTVGAGQRTAVRLSDHVKREDLALLVRSSEPVVVERALFEVGGPGISATIGIPLRPFVVQR